MTIFLLGRHEFGNMRLQPLSAFWAALESGTVGFSVAFGRHGQDGGYGYPRRREDLMYSTTDH